MPRPNVLPCVLSLGGLDPGGGAGLLADARAVHASGAFACGVATALTVQSTSGLRDVRPVAPALVLAQAREVLRHQRVRAIKTGALGSAANVRAVAELLGSHKDVPVVVDPVMLPTRGRARLLSEAALTSLKRLLLPRAALVTANVPEAEALSGLRITRASDAEDAARRILAFGPRAVLVKGGHFGGSRAIDTLVVAGEEAARIFALPRLKIPPVHGTGCTLAAYVAGCLAQDEEGDDDFASRIVLALGIAKKKHHRALEALTDVGGDLRVMFA